MYLENILSGGFSVVCLGGYFLNNFDNSYLYAGVNMRFRFLREYLMDSKCVNRIICVIMIPATLYIIPYFLT